MPGESKAEVARKVRELAAAAAKSRPAWATGGPDWTYTRTELPCPGCGEGLVLVDDSTLLFCENAGCERSRADEPMFLAPGEEDRG